MANSLPILEINNLTILDPENGQNTDKVLTRDDVTGEVRVLEITDVDTNYWDLVGSDIENNNSGLVKVKQGLRISPGSVGTVGASVKALVSQTADLIQVINETDVVQSKFQFDGSLNTIQPIYGSALVNRANILNSRVNVTDNGTTITRNQNTGNTLSVQDLNQTNTANPFEISTNIGGTQAVRIAAKKDGTLTISDAVAPTDAVTLQQLESSTGALTLDDVAENNPDASTRDVIFNSVDVQELFAVSGEFTNSLNIVDDLTVGGDAIVTGNITSNRVTSGNVQIGSTTESGFNMFSEVDGNINNERRRLASNTATHSVGSNHQRSRGTLAAKTAIQSGDRIAVYSFGGYDGLGFQNTGRWIVSANENFVNGSNLGTKMVFETTKLGTTADYESLEIAGDKTTVHGTLVVDNAPVNNTDAVRKIELDAKVANDLTASTTVAPSKTAVNTALASKTDKVSTTTDNAIVRFDGTTGNQQNSNVLVDDNGGIVLASQASPTYSARTIVFDAGNDCFTAYNNDSNVSLQIGQENWVRVVNNTGSTIANGAAVYVNGSSGGLPTVALARADAAATTVGLGLATEAIANGATGYVTSIGLVRGLDTSAFTTGSVFLSATTAGALTQTAPTAPNYRYRVGFVTNVNATTGTIHVTPSTAALGNGTANQVFGINNAGTAQETKSITGTANQITVSNSPGVINLQMGWLSASAVLDFPSTSTQNTSELTMTVAGAAEGDMVILGVPAANGLLTRSSFFAFVSAANTVTVRFINISSSSQNPVSGTYNVKVIKP